MRTKDLGFAATAVLKGHTWTHIEEFQGRVEIQFPDTAALHELRDQYAQDKVLVPPRAFWAMLKSLKSRAQDELRVQRPRPQHATEGEQTPWRVPTGT